MCSARHLTMLLSLCSVCKHLEQQQLLASFGMIWERQPHQQRHDFTAVLAWAPLHHYSTTFKPLTFPSKKSKGAVPHVTCRHAHMHHWQPQWHPQKCPFIGRFQKCGLADQPGRVSHVVWFCQLHQHTAPHAIVNTSVDALQTCLMWQVCLAHLFRQFVFYCAALCPSWHSKIQEF